MSDTNRTTDPDERLKFADDLVAPVLRGEKTATVRLNGPALDVGWTVPATTDDGEPFATLEIRRTATVLAVEAHSVLQVFGAEYPAETPQDVIDAVAQHYDQPVKPSTPVDVYVFDRTDDGGA